MKKLQLSKIVAIVALFVFTISLLLPYTSYFDYETSKFVSSSSSGFDEKFFLMYIFFVPLFILFLVKHFQVLRYLCIIGSVLLLGLILFMMNIAFRGDYVKPNLGFYLMLTASLLFLVAAIFKLLVPVENNKQSNDILDQF